MQNLQIIKNQDHSITILHPNPQYSLIWLHGRGDKCQRFLPFFSNQTLFQNIKVKLLQASQKQIGVNKKCEPAWYDIRSYDRFSGDQREVFNFDHIEDTMKVVNKLMKEEVQFWKEKKVQHPEKKVFIGGFSQGAVMSLFYGMDGEVIPGGIGVFGGYMLKSSKYENLGKTKILILHGEKDEILIESECKDTYLKLLEDKENVEYITIKDLEHTVSEEQMKIFSEWIKKTLN